MRGVFILVLGLVSVTASARVPAVQEVQEESLRAAGYDRGEIRDWKRQSRWAAALPRLQVGFDRQLKDVVQLSTRDNISLSGGEVLVGPNENNFDQDFQQGTGFEVRAVWYLDELVFSRDRLEASRETRNWLEDRSRLLERVTEIYYHWKREQEQLRKEEFAARLDAYTGGWFSGELRR